ncbi:uncharacterized protein KNAG_0B05650 [Huiozyma naganishii CBS 8797]|uniref:Sulfhydryl oxidase n=1 Tax=Huiozyma naganishii (strain ATCC MYA-139 / BCRC 22969 / CBS 8797 / KCTC 17520 / NBRC 10181 / NCYC 3082 / Yp74L-3) TaxID=1071383 RepID=J7RVQ2_HUIN7|nr:hypothetical protein KNAG_0B05650 [Kazachstania naganishii CBS 8797]CCK68997.1 hypothetical protein KNAG_0B05650 [Kazachstania naganishii CBS 8797]
MSDAPKKTDVGPSGRKIIYNPDGTVCRSCNTLVDFQFVTGKISKKNPPPTADSVPKKPVPARKLIPGSRSYTQIPPPSPEQIGRSSWTMLHAIAAKYPDQPDVVQKQEIGRFVKLFGKFYPVESQRDQISSYLVKDKLNVESKRQFAGWLNSFHNEINRKLGKEQFDFKFWENRWVNGWD